MVAVNEIPLIPAESLQTFDFICCALGELQCHQYAAYPAITDGLDCPCADALPSGITYQEFGQCKQMDRYGADNGIYNHE